MPVGHPDVRNVGFGNVITPWTFFLVALSQPVKFYLIKHSEEEVIVQPVLLLTLVIKEINSLHV